MGDPLTAGAMVAGPVLGSMLAPTPAPQTPQVNGQPVGGGDGQNQMVSPYMPMPTFQASNPFMATMNPTMGANPFTGGR